jgi:hypothetical protein
VIDAALAEKAEVALKALPDATVCLRLKAITGDASFIFPLRGERLVLT